MKGGKRKEKQEWVKEQIQERGKKKPQANQAWSRREYSHYDIITSESDVHEKNQIRIKHISRNYNSGQ